MWSGEHHFGNHPCKGEVVMTIMKYLYDTFFDEKQDYTSNRLKTSRRAMYDRRRRCVMYMILDKRSGEDRRKENERRKRWKRVGHWGSEIDRDSYLKGYHVS